MLSPLFWLRSNSGSAAKPVREPLRRAMTATKENRSGRRILLQPAASSPRSSDRPRIRGGIHPSGPLSHRRRPIRDPNAVDVEEATRQDEKKRDNSQESPVCPRDSPVAEHASTRVEE